MAHHSRARSGRSARAAKFHRSGLSTAETVPQRNAFSVIFVWGAHDLTERKYVTPDRKRAIRFAKERVQDGAPIVLVKQNRSHASQKLIADFSTVGGV